MVVQVPGGEGSQGSIVQGVGGSGPGLDDVALIQLELDLTGHILLGHLHKCLHGFPQGGEPFPLIYDLGQLIAHVFLHFHGGPV